MKNLDIWINAGFPKLDVKIPEQKRSMTFAEGVKASWEREWPKDPWRLLKFAFWVVVYAWVYYVTAPILRKVRIAREIIKFLWQDV